MECEYCKKEIVAGSEVKLEGYYFCNNLHRRSWQTQISNAGDGLKQKSKEKKRDFNKIIATVITVTFVVLAANFIPRLISKVFDNEQLVKISNEINKTCPFMVDQDTRLDNTISGPDKKFTYNYTLINHSYKEINVKELEDNLRPRMINNIKTNEQMKYVRDNDISMVFKYSDKFGNNFLDIVLNPSDYK